MTRRVEVNWAVEVDEVEYDLECTCCASAGRPVPYCNNPDDPRFSDDGDGPCVEDVLIESCDPPLDAKTLRKIADGLTDDDGFCEAALQALADVDDEPDADMLREQQDERREELRWEQP